MSTGKRAYDLLRGYVNREWERIQGVDEDNAAQQELDAAMDAPRPYRPPVKTAAGQPPMVIPNRDGRAREILGVEQNSDFEDIRKAFERLNRRSDPGKFPANSTERTQAADIQKRVQWAYSVLTEKMDTTEKRFKSLEID